MSASTHASSMSWWRTEPRLRGTMFKRGGQLLLQTAITAALLFGTAGDWRWVPAWLLVGFHLMEVTAGALWLMPRNPDVIAARSRVPWKDTAPFDKVVLPLYTLTIAAVYVVGALDGGRFLWAPLGWPWVVAGAGLLLLGMLPVIAAMAVNRNLEPTVRIQTERGHQVATSGPYRLVRHPMYLGQLVQAPGLALVLGSTWALLPAAAAMVVLVVRTTLEDRTLQRDLPGYREYAARTRFRLIPGVW